MLCCWAKMGCPQLVELADFRTHRRRLDIRFSRTLRDGFGFRSLLAREGNRDIVFEHGYSGPFSGGQLARPARFFRHLWSTDFVSAVIVGWEAAQPLQAVRSYERDIPAFGRWRHTDDDE